MDGKTQQIKWKPKTSAKDLADRMNDYVPPAAVPSSNDSPPEEENKLEIEELTKELID